MLKKKKKRLLEKRANNSGFNGVEKPGRWREKVKRGTA